MTFLLVALAAFSAVNPARVAASIPPTERTGLRLIIGSAGLAAVAVVAMAAFSGPLINSIGVSASSAIIAAGVALLVVGVRDSVIAPPTLEVWPRWPLAALVPVFFPTIFTPALALIAVAAGADRGLVVGSLATMVGVGVSLGASLLIVRSGRVGNGRGLRAVGSVAGLIAVTAGVLVATRGVMSI